MTTRFLTPVALLLLLFGFAFAAAPVARAEIRSPGVMVLDSECHERPGEVPLGIWLWSGEEITLLADHVVGGWQMVAFGAASLDGQKTCWIEQYRISPGMGGIVEGNAVGGLNPGGDKSDEAPVMPVQDPPPVEYPNKGQYPVAGWSAVDAPIGLNCRWEPDMAADVRLVLTDGTVVVRLEEPVGNWQHIAVAVGDGISWDCYVWKWNLTEVP